MTAAVLRSIDRPRILHVVTHDASTTPALTPASSEPAGTLADLLTTEYQLLNSAAFQTTLVAGEAARFTASDLAALDLRDTELAVFSTCNGGRGTREGVAAMRWALVLAGVQTQVLSLWNVAEPGAPALMRAFYEHLGRGDTPAESMQAAQRTLRASEDLGHPYYWSSFVVSGRYASQPRREAPVQEPPPVEHRGCRGSIASSSDTAFLALLLLRRRRSRRTLTIERGTDAG